MGLDNEVASGLTACIYLRRSGNSLLGWGNLHLSSLIRMKIFVFEYLSGKTTRHPQIADFGLARHLPQGSLAESMLGSPLYMAPEVLSNMACACSVWGWGEGRGGRLIYRSNLNKIFGEHGRNVFPFPNRLRRKYGTPPCCNLIGLWVTLPVTFCYMVILDSYLTAFFVGRRDGWGFYLPSVTLRVCM